MICRSCGDECEFQHEFRAMDNYPDYCGCGWHRVNRRHLQLCCGCQVTICEIWLAQDAAANQETV